MFKNLKSLFVTTEETESTVTAPGKQPERESVKPTVHQENVVSEIDTTAPQVSDEAIVEKLLKALENNNQAGFDYFEYKRSLKSLEKLPMDEATKYQSAFATAATMEVTLEKLFSSIEFYKNVLKQEEANFLKTSKEQYEKNVVNKKADIEKITNLIKDKSQKIQLLTEEIREHQKSQEEISAFITAADTKIKATESSFEFALNDLIKQMENDMIKLKQYVK